MSANNQIFITSINKATDSAKVNGKVDLSIIALFGLYKYYIDFTQRLIDSGFINYKEVNRCLKDDAVRLKYKYPDVICQYKTIVKYFPSNSISENEAPVVADIFVDIMTGDSFNFTPDVFNDEFIDSNGDSIKKVRFDNVNNINGSLRYQGVIITMDTFEIPFSNINQLEYFRLQDTLFTDTLSYRVADTGIPSLYSNEADLTIIGSSQVDNQPATIGDNTIYVDNRTTTILTLAMFTSSLKPPYNDPENDLIDAIRIDEISTANEGTFYYNGLPIIEGLIITREDLAANLFTHIGPNQDSISSDVFNFSARDEGSQIWVK